MAFTQQDRLMSFHTDLGENVFLLRSFHGHEGISQLFSFECELIHEGDPIPFEDIIGKPATIQIILSGNERRFFNGHISRFAQTSSESGIYHYQAELVPWLWFLTRTADCRIFQNKSVPTLIEELFQEFGFSDYEVHLGEFPEREYCVQYRETAFNFISRLMEQYGIFYFWKHERDKHILVLGDSTASYQPVPFQPPVKWDPRTDGLEGEDVITSLVFQKQIHPGKFTHRDFDFRKNPSARIIEYQELTATPIAGNEALEIYDYPGEFPEKCQAEHLGTIRMQEEEAKHFLIKGSSNCRAFMSGYHFTLKEYLPVDLNQSYLLTEIVHQGSMGQTYGTGTQVREEGGYTNTFTCIPTSVLFRPPQLTPQPIVQGPQTAMVVGKAGEEIWTDKYGRVKLLFHWNRESGGDEHSSCWTRVSQLWAGRKWGSMFLPRIGQEVIVEFLEGDPDRPMVTGRVYNEESQPPYELPAEQTKSTIKSCSSPGGNGFNEFRFEDKKDQEQIFIHAEKNMDVRVKNDVYETVIQNTHVEVGGDQYEQTGKDHHCTVGQDHKIEIKRDHHHKISGKEAKQVDGCLSLTVGGDVIEVFKANHSEETSGDTYIKASNIILEAMTNITLKVGGSYIAIEASGITSSASGSNELLAGGKAIMKGSTGITIETPATAEIKGTTTSVDGSGELTLTGGVVKIN